MTAATHADHAARIATVGPTILLSTGRYFSFLDPQPLTIEEIAHSLSKQCRFTGHIEDPEGIYSVAQHSVLVSLLVPPEMALWGLLHDAVEAVVGDMSGPLKKLLPEYKAIEDRCERVILAAFGLDMEDKPPRVKREDLVALRTEQRDLMHPHGGLWTCLDGLQPVPGMKLDLWTPGEARRRFLLRYAALRG